MYDLVSTKEAGDGNLSVKIKQSGNRLTHEQNRIDINVYEITFIPETHDECTIHILFNGENNCKSTEYCSFIQKYLLHYKT